jgi:hypothetical protein
MGFVPAKPGLAGAGGGRRSLLRRHGAGPNALECVGPALLAGVPLRSWGSGSFLPLCLFAPRWRSWEFTSRCASRRSDRQRGCTTRDRARRTRRRPCSRPGRSHASSPCAPQWAASQATPRKERERGASPGGKRKRGRCARGLCVSKNTRLARETTCCPAPAHLSAVPSPCRWRCPLQGWDLGIPVAGAPEENAQNLAHVTELLGVAEVPGNLGGGGPSLHRPREPLRAALSFLSFL